MRKIVNIVLTVCFLTGAFLGCKHNSLLPVNDEVLTYPLPYDLTFLRTLEAIQQHPDWNLDWTDKEKGIISIRNMRFSSYADADQREAILLVKRLSLHETAVQFDPKSQAVVGGDEILSLIRQSLSRELSQR